MQHLNMSRSEVLNTPTYERRFYLGLLQNSMEEREAAAEEETQSLGKGRRQVTSTGEALKMKLRNNEIPNE